MMSDPDQQNRVGCMVFSTVLGIFLLLCLVVVLTSRDRAISPAQLEINS